MSHESLDMSEAQNSTISFRFTWPFKGKASGLAERIVGENMELDIQDLHIRVRMPDPETIEAVTSILAEPELLDDLERAGLDAEKLALRHRHHLAAIRESLETAARRLLQVVKFYLGGEQVSETQLRNFFGWEWSLNGGPWENGPSTFTVGDIDIRAFPGYQGDLRANTTTAVTAVEPPVLLQAMRHLCRAKQEREPRYRWIDATIAAELGIKEFLFKFKPELEPLLIEVPSPPLHKLYGAILENYAGEPSPKLKAIQKGVEIRNKLIHRPTEHPIGAAKADDYVKSIEVAILHLHMLLYPHDDVIRYRYEVLIGE